MLWVCCAALGGHEHSQNWHVALIVTLASQQAHQHRACEQNCYNKGQDSCHLKIGGVGAKEW